MLDDFRVQGSVFNEDLKIYLGIYQKIVVFNINIIINKKNNKIADNNFLTNPRECLMILVKNLS